MSDRSDSTKLKVSSTSPLSGGWRTKGAIAGNKLRVPPYAPIAGLFRAACFTLRPDLGLFLQDHVQQRFVNFELSVVFDETQLAELVHEKAHAGSGRADHLCQHFLTVLSDDRLRTAFLAEICKEKEKSGEALFARIEQLIDQVLFNSTVPVQKIRHEQFRKFRLLVNGGDHGRLLQASDHAIIADRPRGCDAHGMAIQTSF